MPLPRKPCAGREGPPVRHEDCWAKTTPGGRPGISVEQHCRTAGIVARLLAARQPAWLAGRLENAAGVTLAALHDIGKVAPGFQKKCPAWLAAHAVDASRLAGLEADHARISQRTGQELLARDDLRFWAAIMGAHHGSLKADRVGPLCDGGPAWQAERDRLAATLLAEFGPLPGHTIDFDCGTLWFNAGLIAVADWLASDERTFPPSKELTAAEIEERARAQLGRIGFRQPRPPVAKRFRDLFAFEPNALQTVMEAAIREPGVYVVEASMGSGKTEAALMAASNLLTTGKATGLYFALPTQTTSNRIHTRVAEFVERLSPGAGTRLIHGASWMLDPAESVTGSRCGPESEHAGRDWFASTRRALLAPFGVGTVDQALLGVVAAKHFFVRQYGLAGKVVILDEVHAYDLYTGTLIDRLVARLRDLGATAIVLSATLTATRRQQLLGLADAVERSAEYPLVSGSVSGECLQRAVPAEQPKTVGVGFQSAAALPDHCMERAERGACVLWIRNTVHDAQDTYRMLCGLRRGGGPEIALLHARFPQFRREELEGLWLDRLGKEQARRPAQGCILVATQVAEQSVDIDADFLITDLAPTDMLLQRLGRLWRHARPRPPGCRAPALAIALPALDLAALRVASVGEIKAALGRSARVYAPYVLLRTLAVWRERGALTLPADIRGLIEATYAEAASEPPAWAKPRAELEREKEKLRSRALANANVWDIALPDEEGVQTRWGGCPTAALVLADKVVRWDSRRGARLALLNGETCEMRPNGFDYATVKALHRNLVKVPRWAVRQWLRETPIWLREYVTGAVLVGELRGGHVLACPAGADTGLAYRADLGVVLPPWQSAESAGRDPEEGDDESYDG